MEKLIILRLTRPGGIFLLFVSMMIFFTQCTKSDDEEPHINIERGTDSFGCVDCTPQDYLEGLVTATDNGGIFAAYGLVPAQQWFLDVPHSAVNWETWYNSEGANLTGKFSWFALKELSFDETDPSKISFEANVLLNSVVTGQPLRDQGCLQATFETDLEKFKEPENLAVLKSVSAVYNTDDEGYTIDGELTFLGVTHDVSIQLFYLGQTSFTGYTLAGFEAEFTFNAISDHGLNSTSVADLITIKMNLNLKNNE